MQPDYTTAGLLAAGLTVLSTVVGILWRKLEGYQTKIEKSLEDTNKQLMDCEKQKFELLQQKFDIEYKKGG